MNKTSNLIVVLSQFYGPLTKGSSVRNALTHKDKIEKWACCGFVLSAQ